ncbi:MAG TPA: TadE/TadG family type IV pilus assembly protein [Acidimicrobiales bacterium]
MSSRLDRGSGRGWRHDETGSAIVELALVIPLVVLLLGAAFNGWNGMQQTIRLTSAARAGAIVAANDLTTTSSHPATTQDQALADATTAINAEEGATNVYQSIDSSANNYVSVALTPNETISGPVAISVVTITISHASVSFVPFVGSFPVTTHATARYG